jgi:hypothetical protein
MNLDDVTSHLARFRIPADVIANMKFLRHEFGL